MHPPPLRTASATASAIASATAAASATASASAPPRQVLDGPAPSLSRAAADRQRFLGLVGGYSAYNSSVSVRLLPLRLAAAWTNFLRGRHSAR